jgi:hypothetical protein
VPLLGVNAGQPSHLVNRRGADDDQIDRSRTLMCRRGLGD